MDCKLKTYKITNIISYFIFLLAYIFIITQSIINIKYSQNENKLIIAERLVYEEFAHQVYSNINSKFIENIVINSNCPDDYNIMNIPIKLETFYDCEDANNDNIDSDFCLDKITKASVCCKKGCCLKNINNKKENGYCINKFSYNEYDPRDNVCYKFSQYNGRIYHIGSNKICVKKGNLTYENLLLLSNKENRCYILDSKNNFICSSNLINLGNILNVNNNIIVKNLFSLSSPDLFEMESKIRISKLLNKKKYDEEKIKKEYEKISKISSKNIYDAFNINKSPYIYSYLQNYQNKQNILFSDMTNSNELIFQKFKDNSYINDNTIGWYTRNYIGFNNISELNKFKMYFDSNDYKNNSLYKISKTLFPNYGSAIIGTFVCIGLIIFICFAIKRYKNEGEMDLIIKKIIINNVRFFLVAIAFFVYLIIYLVEYYRFDEIYIDMEDFYSKVIEKYNYRRKQIHSLIGVILLGFNLFFELLIQNLKIDITYISGDNGYSENMVNAYIRFRDSNCKHKIKFNKKKAFQDHIPNIQKVLRRCNKCKNEDIEDFEFKFNNIKINKNDNIALIGITNNCEIIMEE